MYGLVHVNVVVCGVQKKKSLQLDFDTRIGKPIVESSVTVFCFVFVLFCFSDQPASVFPSAGIKGLLYHHLAGFVLETALHISGWLQIAKDNLAGVYSVPLLG